MSVFPFPSLRRVTTALFAVFFSSALYGVECGECQNAVCGTKLEFDEFGVKSANALFASGEVDPNEALCVNMSPSECEAVRESIEGMIESCVNRAEAVQSYLDYVGFELNYMVEIADGLASVLTPLGAATNAIGSALVALGALSSNAYDNIYINNIKRSLYLSDQGNITADMYLTRAKSYISSFLSANTNVNASLLTSAITEIDSARSRISTVRSTFAVLGVLDVSSVRAPLELAFSELAGSYHNLYAYQSDLLASISRARSSLYDAQMNLSDFAADSPAYDYLELDCSPCTGSGNGDNDGVGTNGCCNVVRGMAVDLGVIKELLNQILAKLEDIRQSVATIQQDLRRFIDTASPLYEKFNQFNPVRISSATNIYDFLRDESNSAFRNWFTRLDVFNQSAALDVTKILSMMEGSGFDYYYSSFSNSASFRANSYTNGYDELDTWWKRIEYLLYTVAFPKVDTPEVEEPPLPGHETERDSVSDEIDEAGRDLKEGLQETLSSKIDKLKASLSRFAESLFHLEPPTHVNDSGIILEIDIDNDGEDDNHHKRLELSQKDLIKLNGFLVIVRKAFIIIWHCLSASLTIMVFWAVVRFVGSLFMEFVKMVKDVV